VGLRPALQADLALLGASAIWGSTFVLVKRALDDASPAAFLTARFALAAIVLAVIFRRRLLPFRLDTALAGILLGVLLAAGFILQTWGLARTTPSRSAFLTGLAVVIVPLMAAILRIRRPTAAGILGSILATGGLYLLAISPARGTYGDAPQGIGLGEVLTILCSVVFASHIIGVDILGRRHDPGSLVSYQIAAAAILLAPMALFAETPRLSPTPLLLGAILTCALFSTALTFWIQNSMQPRTTPTRAAIILASEPVFAAATSFVIERERLSMGAVAGAALILCGMLAAEFSSVGGRESPA